MTFLPTPTSTLCWTDVWAPRTRPCQRLYTGSRDLFITICSTAIALPTANTDNADATYFGATPSDPYTMLRGSVRPTSRRHPPRRRRLSTNHHHHVRLPGKPSFPGATDCRQSHSTAIAADAVANHAPTQCCPTQPYEPPPAHQPTPGGGTGHTPAHHPRLPPHSSTFRFPPRRHRHRHTWGPRRQKQGRHASSTPRQS